MAVSEVKKQLVVRMPACLARHRPELLHGLHLARLADKWDVLALYPAASVVQKKLTLTREEWQAIEAVVRDYGLRKRTAVIAALHCAGRDRLSRTYAADCRMAAGGCALPCRAEVGRPAELAPPGLPSPGGRANPWSGFVEADPSGRDPSAGAHGDRYPAAAE